jgi:hypothetical protein
LPPAKAKRLSKLKQNAKAKKKCGPWKSGNPKSGFPLSHSPESPAAQGKERPFTQTT